MTKIANCIKKHKIIVLELNQSSANLNNLENDADIVFNKIDAIYGTIFAYKPIQYLNGNKSQFDNYTHKITVNYKSYFENGIQDLLINGYHYSIKNFIIEHEQKKVAILYCNKQSKLDIDEIN